MTRCRPPNPPITRWPDHRMTRSATGPLTRPFLPATLPCRISISLAKIAAMGNHEVVVYSRRGCHLCEVVKESLIKLERRGGFTWRDIDVDSDDDLRRQFTDEVPVVFIDGKKAFKYRMDEREFLHRLATR